MRVEFGLERGEVRLGDVDQEQVLLVGEADGIQAGRAVFRREVGDDFELAAADAAAGEVDADPVEAGLFLRVDAEVIGLLVLELGEIGVALEREIEARLDFLRRSRSHAPVRDEELEPRAVALEAVAFVAEDLADGLDHGPDLLGPDEERAGSAPGAARRRGRRRP